MSNQTKNILGMEYYRWLEGNAGAYKDAFYNNTWDLSDKRSRANPNKEWIGIVLSGLDGLPASSFQFFSNQIKKIVFNDGIERLKMKVRILTGLYGVATGSPTANYPNPFEDGIDKFEQLRRINNHPIAYTFESGHEFKSFTYGTLVLLSEIKGQLYVTKNLMTAKIINPPAGAPAGSKASFERGSG